MDKLQSFINKVISLTYSDRDENISGMVLEHNNLWTLLAYNPVDYVHDGYTIVNHKHLDGFDINEHDKVVEKVFALKGVENSHTNMQLSNICESISYLSQHYPLFQIEPYADEDICFIGKIISAENGYITMKHITPNAQWENELEQYDIESIRTISYDSDYLISLNLLANN